MAGAILLRLGCEWMRN